MGYIRRAIRRAIREKIMENKKAIYYQYRPELKYQVFLRLEDHDLDNTLSLSFENLGFKKLEEDELKGMAFDKSQTRVLKISEASPRVASQIRGFGSGLESYGPESLSSHGNYQIYRYNGFGMMVFSENTPSWELGLVNPGQNREKFEMMLVRFLSWALASRGVVGFWAVPVEEGFVVMKPVESKGEAVFIDMGQMKIITRDGFRPLNSELQVLRLDETLTNESKKMAKEALLSFLTTNSTHFSYHGLNPAMRTSLYEFTSIATGFVYPTVNFRPRANIQEAS